MEKIEAIKMALLKSKLKEHFSKHPKEKSAVVLIKYEGKEIAWKAEKAKNGFNIVEVASKKNRYFLKEAPENVPPGIPAGSTSSAEAFDKMTFQQKIDAIKQGGEHFNGANIMSMFTDPAVTGSNAAMKQLEDSISSGIQASKALLDKKLKYIASIKGQLTAQRDARAHMADSKNYKSGKSIREKKEDNEKKAPKQDNNKSPEDVGLEKQADKFPEKPQNVPTPSAQSPEETQLQQLVQGKPIKNIMINTDDTLSVISLTLAGLHNVLEIIVNKNGEISYKVGELVRVLKAMPSDDE